ncbi:FAD-dependent oxidoreductase [Hydrogenophilus thermoluteolus]|nr:FAD-dependent oxidoreductase [Hydrogenophilus thermoluteolus]MBW7656666.1 FAD-dependent oxidoreductase [Hydrogenophilus thermoluteolus]
MKRIVVIGAGAAGLTAGWRLARWGYSVIVLEKRAQLGGALAELTENALRFPAAAPTLKQLMRTGVLSLQPLRSLPFTWGDDAGTQQWSIPATGWPKIEGTPVPHPLFWLWRLRAWGRRHPDTPLDAWFRIATPPAPLSAALTQLAAQWCGESVTTLTWPRLAPLLRAIMRFSAPQRHAWQVAEAASEWFAVALARRIGRFGQVVQIASPVMTLTPHGDSGWRVTTVGQLHFTAAAVVVATEPQDAAPLLPAELGRTAARLHQWPQVLRWGSARALPQMVAKPVRIASHLWLAGDWLPPIGALPGLESAVASGWTTARAVRAALSSQ